MTPLSEPLRLGVVGCGAVTERYHLPAILATSEVRAVAFADPAVERARALAARAGGAEALSSHRELPGRVDLALVAAPNAVHEAVAVDLLRSGVHVLVEKPMARTVAECDRMLAAAGPGVVLAVGHDFRHYPVARFGRAAFAAGLVGEVRSVDVRQSAGGRWPAVSTAVLSPEAGGGVLLDFGVHLLDLLLWWLGDMEVRAYRDDAAGGVESECEVHLELGSRCPVRMELSRTRSLRDTVVVEGERGSLELGVFQPAVIRLSLPGGSAPLEGAVPDPDFDRAPLPTVFGRQLADTVAAIREGRRPLVDGAAARRVVALVEACYARRQRLERPWDYPTAYAGIGRSGA